LPALENLCFELETVSEYTVRLTLFSFASPRSFGFFALSRFLSIFYCRGEAVRDYLIPALEDLITDPESVIRQHVAAQLLPISVVCMSKPNEWKVEQLLSDPDRVKDYYDDEGYSVVIEKVIPYLNSLLADTDLDVRRAAATSLAGLALQIEPEDVPAHCLPVPLRFVYQKPQNPNAGKKKSEADQRLEELRITSANLLAELGGAASENATLNAEAQWVGAQVLPAVLELCEDPSFRVRRSGVQALPRILGACSFEDVSTKIVPAFERLSQDGTHRIRKSSGECLVDMSRSLMILAGSEQNEERKKALMELRRTKLIPIADRLIQDPHKMVRQGMMQFLGPFIASFYPYQHSPLHTTLPATTESDGSNHMGIAAQFFPHASSMVSRLNSSQNAVTTAPTPVHSSLEQLSPPELSDVGRLKKALPVFIQASRMSSMSLAAVTSHRKSNPPDPEDIAAIADRLLDYFAALAIVSTGDENTDAEMRVYCAYSFPAIVLLLGQENWEGPMKTCFYSLINPDYAKGPDQQKSTESEDDDASEPPLPVKRCLASSLHTVAHVLSPETAAKEIMPVFQEHFLKDSDDSVRLNVIRNFPSLLGILPPADRKKPFLMWSEVVQGEEFLGARNRSATNPLVLNWRQRDYLARSLPDLFGLVDPELLHDQLWPILKELLADSVSTVKEDAIWSIPILLKSYCPDTLKKWPGFEGRKDYSSKCCKEIVDWLKEKVLRLESSSRSKNGNFSDRQLYCQICATVGLALRFSEGLDDDADDRQDPVSVLSSKFRSLFVSSKSEEPTGVPYEKMSSAEEKFLKKLLMDDLIDPALAMKEDRISNVRVTLMKVLQLMPEDVRTSAKCKPVLQNLIEEVETWESFGDESPPLLQQIQAMKAAAASHPNSGQTSSTRRKKTRGPVDVDEVSITPQSSRDEEDAPISRGEQEDVQYKTVVFEDGPIGMQLEPTIDDRACRVFNFLDASPDIPSPAQASGMIEVGDVIVSVNGDVVESYEHTIDMLKSGGRREIVFRPGREEDGYGDEYPSGDEGAGGSTDEEGDKEKKKKEKKPKKDSKKTKKKDEKKAKKVKKEPKKSKKDSQNEDDAAS